MAFVRSIGRWAMTALVVNYRGVRNGANLSSVMTVAKLSPLVLLILFGVVRFAHKPEMIRVSEIASPGFSNWVSAMALLVFAFGGWEDGLIATGEINMSRSYNFGVGVNDNGNVQTINDCLVTNRTQANSLVVAVVSSAQLMKQEGLGFMALPANGTQRVPIATGLQFPQLSSSD
jgi:hypothetical protein